MSKKFVLQNFFQLIRSIEVCIENKWTIPALTLLYSGIDTIGWIVSENEFATKQSFTDWVEKKLLPKRSFLCTSLDLYAARCGVLHTQTPESSLYSKGEVKKISYAWGDAVVEDVQKSIVIEQRGDLVAVHLDDLFWAFREGLADTIIDLSNNHVLAERLDTKAGKGFSNLSKKDLKEYLDRFLNDR